MAENVLFKKGLLANLPKGDAIVNGAIYMTTDEGGIYLGQNGALKRMGDFIVGTYEEISKITNASTSALYYATNHNILMRYNGTNWVQINSQKTIDQLIGSLEAAIANNTLTIKITDANGVEHADLTSSVSFAGANGAQVTSKDNVLTIDATKYELKTAANTEAATLNLVGTGGADVGTDAIAIKGAGLASVSSDASGNITVNVGEFSASESASATGNVATVTQSISDANSKEITSSSHKIKGAGDITVTATGNEVTISGKDTVGALSAANNKITLNNATNGGTATAAGSISLEGAGTLAPSVTATGNKLTVNVNAPVVTTAFDNNGVLTTALEVDNVAIAGSSATITPIIKVGKTEESVKFANGTADLNVYTISEVDALLSGLNAMTFKGAKSANDIKALKGVQNGDTYKVSALGTINGTTVEVGDLVIYNGADLGAGVAAVETNWTIIPSADEEIITYALKAADGSFTISENSNTVVGTVEEGTMIEITKVNDNTAKISHANKTGIVTSAAAEQSLSAFGDANTSVTFMRTVEADGQGHVAKAQAGTLSFDPIASVAVNTAASSTSAATIGMTLTSASAIDLNATAAKLASSTLEFTQNADTGLNIDLVWGSF